MQGRNQTIMRIIATYYTCASCFPLLMRINAVTVFLRMVPKMNPEVQEATQFEMRFMLKTSATEMAAVASHDPLQAPWHPLFQR